MRFLNVFIIFFLAGCTCSPDGGGRFCDRSCDSDMDCVFECGCGAINAKEECDLTPSNIFGWHKEYTLSCGEQYARCDNNRCIETDTDIGIGCSPDIQLRIYSIRSQPELCFTSDSRLEIMLENIGVRTIQGIHITIYSGQETFEETIPDSMLKVGSVGKFVRPYVFQEGQKPERVIITPMGRVNGQGDLHSCDDLAIEAKDIRPCD